MAFPYAPRPGQGRLVRAIGRTQSRGAHLLAEAATGTGKTICALTGSLPAVRAGQRIIYATRANSQQTQVMREHRALRDAADPGLLVPFMGRRHYCPLLADRADLADGTPEELGRMCRRAKQLAQKAHATGQDVKGACPYYLRLLADGPDPVEALLEDAADPATLAAQVAEVGSCPYEALKAILPRASIVVVPYIFLIDEHLRSALQQWMGALPHETHLVLDEAHNLPGMIRSHHSPRLGLPTVQRALNEVEIVDDPVLAGKVLASSFLAALHRCLRALVTEFAADRDDGILHPDALKEALLMALGIPSPALARMIQDLETYADVVRQKRLDEGRLPRSYMGAVAAFLSHWQLVEDHAFVHLAVREPQPALEIQLLDASLRSRWLLEAASSVHMSGTLAPLQAHGRAIGLPSARHLRLASPFDPKRLIVAGVAGVRRSHAMLRDEPDMLPRQAGIARRHLGAMTGRTALWFPSHDALRTALDDGLLHGLDVALYEEAQGMTTAALQRMVDSFREDPNPHVVLAGVLGGRLTEGIDYPGDALQQVLIFGIPYPRPSARLDAAIRYHDGKGGDGWRTSIHHPVGRVVRQAVGRLIRGPDDQGTVIVLDDRITRFRDHLPTVQMIGPEDALPTMGVDPDEGFRPALQRVHDGTQAVRGRTKGISMQAK